MFWDIFTASFSKTDKLTFSFLIKLTKPSKKKFLTKFSQCTVSGSSLRNMDSSVESKFVATLGFRWIKPSNSVGIFDCGTQHLLSVALNLRILHSIQNYIYDDFSKSKSNSSFNKLEFDGRMKLETSILDEWTKSYSLLPWEAVWWWPFTVS